MQHLEGEKCGPAIGRTRTRIYLHSKEPERDESMTAATKNLEKWLFYFDRFNNHEVSSKLDQALCEATEEKMVEVQEASDLSWIEVGSSPSWLPCDLIETSFAVQVHETCRRCADAVSSDAQMELCDGVLPCTRQPEADI